MERLPRNYTMMCDEYEYTMSEGYMSCKKNDEEAVFDVFFRKVPNGGGYAVMAGLDKIIEYIKNIKFTDEFISKNPKEYIEYLKEILNSLGTYMLLWMEHLYFLMSH